MTKRSFLYQFDFVLTGSGFLLDSGEGLKNFQKKKSMKFFFLNLISLSYLFFNLSFCELTDTLVLDFRWSKGSNYQIQIILVAITFEKKCCQIWHVRAVFTN